MRGSPAPETNQGASLPCAMASSATLACSFPNSASAPRPLAKQRTQACGGAGAIAGLDEAGADAIVKRPVEAGIIFIDTADVSSNGVSEQIVDASIKYLGIKRSDVVIATKVCGAMGSRPNDKGASRGHIMDAIEGSLSRLGTDHIDLYQIHADDSVKPIDETLRAPDDLVASGKVRRGSRRCRRIIRLRGAIWNEISCRC